MKFKKKSFQQQTEDVLGTFRKAAQELILINDKIDAANAQIDEDGEMLRLEHQAAELKYVEDRENLRDRKASNCRLIASNERSTEFLRSVLGGAE